MKNKLLLLLFLIVGYAGFSQPGTPGSVILQTISQPNVFGDVKGGLIVRGALVLPANDTLSLPNFWKNSPVLASKNGELFLWSIQEQKYKPAGGGFRPEDTAAVNGVPRIASGYYTKQLLDFNRRQIDSFFVTAPKHYIVNGDTIGYVFETALQDFIFLNGDTSGVEYLTKEQADGYYKPVGYVPTFAELLSKPTTIAGYGITDAFTQTAADARYRPITYVPTWSEILSKPTTDGISEGTTNLYFTNSRSRGALNAVGPISYNSTSGQFSLDTSKTATAAATYGTLMQQVNILNAAKLNTNPAISGATKTKITYDSKGLVTSGADATTSDIAEGSNLYFTNTRAQGAISFNLTNTGTSGPASLNYSGGIVNLNIPNYAGSSLPAVYGSDPTGTTAYIGPSGDDTIAIFRANGVDRSILFSNAIQRWWMSSGGSEIGRLEYATPSNLPGLVIYNPSGTGRTQMRQLGTTGGWALGSTSGSGIPTNHFTLANTGQATFTNDVTAASFTATPVASIGTLANGQIKVGTDNFGYIGLNNENNKIVTANGSGRVLLGGGTDNGTHALQVNGAIQATGIKLTGLQTARAVITDNSGNLASGGYFGYAQQVLNANGAVSLVSGAYEQIVLIGGTTTSISLPAPVDQMKLWLSNQTGNSVTITGSIPNAGTGTYTTIAPGATPVAVKDGSAWRVIK